MPRSVPCSALNTPCSGPTISLIPRRENRPAEPANPWSEWENPIEAGAGQEKFPAAGNFPIRRLAVAAPKTGRYFRCSTSAAAEIR